MSRWFGCWHFFTIFDTNRVLCPAWKALRKLVIFGPIFVVGFRDPAEKVGTPQKRVLCLTAQPRHRDTKSEKSISMSSLSEKKKVTKKKHDFSIFESRLCHTNSTIFDPILGGPQKFGRCVPADNPKKGQFFKIDHAFFRNFSFSCVKKMCLPERTLENENTQKNTKKKSYVSYQHIYN